MLPIRCIQPPCRNIESRTLFALKSRFASKTSGWKSRAGTKASSRRNGSRLGPRESSNTNATAHATISSTFTTGGREDGMSPAAETYRRSIAWRLVTNGFSPSGRRPPSERRLSRRERGGPGGSRARGGWWGCARDPPVMETGLNPAAGTCRRSIAWRPVTDETRPSGRLLVFHCVRLLFCRCRGGLCAALCLPSRCGRTLLRPRPESAIRAGAPRRSHEAAPPSPQRGSRVRYPRAPERSATRGTGGFNPPPKDTDAHLCRAGP